MEIFRGSVEALGGKSVQQWRGKILCLMLSPAPLQQSFHQPKVWGTAGKCRNKCDCATSLLHYYGTWFVLRYYLLVTILILQSATLPTPEMQSGLVDQLHIQSVRYRVISSSHHLYHLNNTWVSSSSSSSLPPLSLLWVLLTLLPLLCLRGAGG